jgi:hypothetical protein
MSNRIGRIASRALALPKSTGGAPHVCSRSLKRSFSNPGSLNSTQQRPWPFFFLHLQRPRLCLQSTGHRSQSRQSLRRPEGLRQRSAGSSVFRSVRALPRSSFRGLARFLHFSEFSWTTFSQLGQDLHSGNLSKAQSAYASLQQEFAPLSSALAASSSSASSNARNVTL